MVLIKGIEVGVAADGGRVVPLPAGGACRGVGVEGVLDLGE